MAESTELESIKRLTRDIKTAAKTLSTTEARFLVDAFYQLQRDRIRTNAQIRVGEEKHEPHETLAWLAGNTALLERNIKSALDAYSDGPIVGQWSKSIVGVGPVIAAGLPAHIDIAKAPTVGHIWRFAGLDPTVTWEKKTKRPWNATLKTLCWKIGESFVKQSGHKDDVYGHLWIERKAYEQKNNDEGKLAEQAAAILKAKKFRDDTGAKKAYESGILPPGHIHARAKRWTVKLFLAHWHAVAYRERFGVNAPKPYVIDILHHAHEIVCPNWPF